jgi:hypothetical protein
MATVLFAHEAPAPRPSAHPDHLAPLDSVLMALQETHCAWCQAMLKLILKHLEVDIPAGWEVLN